MIDDPVAQIVEITSWSWMMLEVLPTLLLLPLEKSRGIHFGSQDASGSGFRDRTADYPREFMDRISLSTE